MTLVVDDNFDWTDATYPGSADFVRLEWVKQDCEATEMRDVLGRQPVNRDLVLEFPLIGSGSDDG